MPASKKPAATKQCRNCGEDFSSNNTVRVYCSKKCTTYASRSRDPEKSRLKAKEYYHQIRDGRRTRDKAGRKIDPDKYKNRKLVERYGITLDDYKAMYQRQNGKCMICELLSENLHVDHNHTTGEVRGLLCNGCNRGLGYFSENPVSLQNAALYLRGLTK